MTDTTGIAALAQPYTEQELADFEALIFASNHPSPEVRLAGRAALARFLREHGKTKCDMMLERLSLKWDQSRGSA